MKHIAYILYICAAVLALSSTQAVSAQSDNQIRGVVTDEEGRPVPGAVVLLSGTSQGVVTDEEGKYFITVDKKDRREGKLVFSCISFETQTIRLTGRNELNVVLKEDHELLEEVVVVGYGTMHKSDMTGAVTSVKIDEEKAQRSTSIDQLLQGQASGVQVVSQSGAPDGGVNVIIRGASSFNSNSQPLYVVDGIIMNTSGDISVGTRGGGDDGIDEEVNGLIGLSPDDIASIEILKDASATAIYGSQGANGVVLITTKDAAKGKPTVTFTGGVSVSVVNGRYDLMDADDYTQFLDMKGVAHNSSYYTIYTKGVENGTYVPVDWQDYCIRESVTQNYSLTIAGRPENASYRFSLGYKDNQGIMKGTGLKNLYSRLNFTKQVGRFEFGARLSFSYLDSRMTQGAGATIDQSPETSLIMSMLQTRPLRRIIQYDNDGDEVDDVDVTLNTSGPDRWLSDYQSQRVEYRVLSGVYGQYEILPWLTFKTTFGIDYKSNERLKFKSSRISRSATGSNGAVAYVDRLNWNWDNLLQFNKKIRKHRINATLGHAASSRHSSTKNVAGTNVIQYKPMAESLNYAPYAWNTYTESQSQLLSFFARAVYSYDRRYSVTATYRLDGSSKFSGKNKWAQFPSFAAAWTLSNEKWFKKLKSKCPEITMIKLRAGWGMVGNQDIPSYRTSYMYTSGTTATHDKPSNSQVILSSQSLPNKNLKWETTSQVNGGVDLDFFDGRLTATMDGYYKVTKDLLQARVVAGSAGINDPYVNMGSIRNAGFELSLNAVPIASKDFDWTIGGNISLNRNKILSIDPSGKGKAMKYVYPGEPAREVEYFTGSKLSSGAVNQDYINVFIVGEPMSLFYALPTDGIIQKGQTGVPLSEDEVRGEGMTNFIDTNQDGIINADDKVVVGDPNPDFIYGFNTSLSYKGFTLSASFVGSYGNDIYHQQKARLSDMSTYSNNRLREAVFNSWTPENPDAKWPAVATFSASELSLCSDRFVEDGSYLRLADASLSYSLPFKNNKSIVKGLVFTISGRNLFCWTKYSGFDPDVNIYGSVLKYGIDMGAYPAARTYRFDVKISF